MAMMCIMVTVTSRVMTMHDSVGMVIVWMADMSMVMVMIGLWVIVTDMTMTVTMVM